MLLSEIAYNDLAYLVNHYIGGNIVFVDISYRWMSSTADIDDFADS